MKRNEEKLAELELINKSRPKWKKDMQELGMHCR